MATWGEFPIYILDRRPRLRSAPVRASFTFIGLLPLLGDQAQTVEFSSLDNEVSGSLDTTLSYGTLWRVQRRDKSNSGINTNDSNCDFDTSLVLEVYKITSDLETTWRNYGMFIRGTAFYDTRIMDKRNDYYSHNGPSQPSQSYPHDDRFTSQTRDIAGHKAEILDVYAYGSWDIGNMPLSVRFGHQVFNWSGGIFYRGGVNTTNPMGAAKYRLPGSELKEMLMPVEALSFSTGLIDNLSMETLYRWSWKETRFNPVGTFLSETDLFADGGNTGYSNFTDTTLGIPMPGFGNVVGLYQALGNNPLLNGVLKSTGLYANGVTPVYDDIMRVPSISKDINARGDSQFGVAFHYIVRELNNVEFGFYFVNYHSKKSTLYADIGDCAGADLAALADTLRPIAGNLAGALANGLMTTDMMGNINAWHEFAEDIRVRGFSFNTTVDNASVFGELAYRPDLSTGIAATNDLIDDLAHGAAEAASGGQINVDGQMVGLDGQIHNYEQVEAFDASLGIAYNFSLSLSFDSLAGVTELASERLHGNNLKCTAYNGSARYYVGCGNGSYVSGSDHGDQVNRSAYGYTLLLSGTWNDMFTGVNVSLYVVYKDDFGGNSYQTGNFIEGRKAYTLGTKVTYLNSLEDELQYTEFYGSGQNNSIRDHDNIGLTVKYSL